MNLRLIHVVSKKAFFVSAFIPPALLAILTFIGCQNQASSNEASTVGVTTSWLECCVKDIAGADFAVTSLCPPGSCPGHFDLRPSQVEKISRCGLLVRFDFQQGLESRLRSADVDIIAVTAPEGLCLPSSYLSACEVVSRALSEKFPEKEDEYTRALVRVRERLAELEARVKQATSENGLRGVQVVASGHQAAFCRWLGLKVEAAYSGAESASPKDLENLLERGKKAEVHLVIANLQEGEQMARALAHHLDAEMITFSNFPNMTPEEPSFDALILNNLTRLLEARKVAS